MKKFVILVLVLSLISCWEFSNEETSMSGKEYSYEKENFSYRHNHYGYHNDFKSKQDTVINKETTIFKHSLTGSPEYDQLLELEILYGEQSPIKAKDFGLLGPKELGIPTMKDMGMSIPLY